MIQLQTSSMKVKINSQLPYQHMSDKKKFYLMFNNVPKVEIFKKEKDLMP